MITCVYLSLLKLTRDYPCTCDIRACIASCSPTCESVTYASLTLARFCGTTGVAPVRKLVLNWRKVYVNLS